jgi:hypothetical protein
MGFFSFDELEKELKNNKLNITGKFLVPGFGWFAAKKS